jgi:hypothetical protein
MPAGVELIDLTISYTGVVVSRYRRAGDIQCGESQSTSEEQSRRSGPKGHEG